ncbi:MAG: two-component system, OmpR family, copper resistance phosphate regulon response regulator CusR [Patescibacteria group bacterium]|nr:two-component system, OmpR family, copper resistance phosphate regulon response regulator CusR [Patescibacteria group bacterium]
MKILLIEDDVNVIDFLLTNLKAESFTVDVAYDGSQGSFMARTNPYDVIIIDYSLPIKNGITVCQEIRSAEIVTPIIFLTIYSDLKKKIIALDTGADDYITKPFSFDELKARIYAIRRRPHKIESPIFTAGDIILDTRKQSVHRNSIPLNLTRKEYNLLEYLIRNKNTVVSRGMIMEHVWNAESDPLSNTVEAHILNLRKKIRDEINNKNDGFIKNIPGRGYIINV